MVTGSLSPVRVAITSPLIVAVVEYSMVPVIGILVILIQILLVYVAHMLFTIFHFAGSCRSLTLLHHAVREPSLLIQIKVFCVDTIFTYPVSVGAVQSHQYVSTPRDVTEPSYLRAAKASYVQ